MFKILGPINWNYIVLSHLKLSALSNMQSLVDMTAVDDIGRGGARLFYILQNTNYTQGLTLELYIGLLSKVLTSVTIYPGLLWLEREVWDMFGVFFWGNPDLRRILTNYGFVGHPLTKEFPLSGFREVWYDDTVRSVIAVGVEFSQEFRSNNY